MTLYKGNPEEYCGEAWEGLLKYNEDLLLGYLHKYLNHLTGSVSLLWGIAYPRCLFIGAHLSAEIEFAEVGV